MTRRIEIRARVAPSPEPPFERLHDALVDELLRGGELARERFPSRWTEDTSVRKLAEAKRAPLEPRLAQELEDYHRRLGASPASLEALNRLRRGEAVAALAGQQPAPLGGPLYSLHKTASAVGLAAVAEARTGVPCVPMFWTHSEDSDFDEIRGATIADSALVVEELVLPANIHPEGGLVGSIPVEPLADRCRLALERWAGLPAQAQASETIRQSFHAARDLGEAHSALMLALFGERGLVVVDPRLPAFRNAARPIIDRYLGAAEAMSSAARHAGERLEQVLGRRPLADSALDSFAFVIDDGLRRKVSVAEARGMGPDRALSPSVALRAVLQDGVFPTVAMACGTAEIAYLAQLREVFEGLGVPPACPVPRLGATWLPPAAVALLEASGVGAWELVTNADAVLKHVAENQVPADVRGELERARTESAAALERFSASARRIDSSLTQMVDSARAKVDYQYARLMEGLTAKLRHRLERQHPEWGRLRYYLMPGDRLQERTLASLEVIAYRGLRVVEELCDLAAEGAQGAAQGRHEHLVLEL